MHVPCGCLRLSGAPPHASAAASVRERPKKLDDQFSVQLNNVSAADLKAGLAKLGAVAVIQQRERGPQEKAASLGFSFSEAHDRERVPVN